MDILRILSTVIFVIAALAMITIVLLQEGKSAGLGSISGSSNGDSYWDKNKKHSLEGKFERWTKLTAFAFIFFAFVLMVLPTSTNGSVQDNTSGVTVTDEITTDAAESTATNEAVTEGAENGTDAATSTEAPATDAANTDTQTKTDGE